MKLDPQATLVIANLKKRIHPGAPGKAHIREFQERRLKNKPVILLEPSKSSRAAEALVKVESRRKLTTRQWRESFGNDAPPNIGRSCKHAILYVQNGFAQVIELSSHEKQPWERRFAMVMRGFPGLAPYLVMVETREAETRRLVVGAWQNKTIIPFHEMPGYLSDQVEYLDHLPHDLDKNQMWLVHYECRPAVIQVAVDGGGFYATGQEPCWGLTAVAKWVRRIEE